MEPTVVVALCISVPAVVGALVIWACNNAIRLCDSAASNAELRVAAERAAARLESENASLTRQNRELLQMLQNVRDAISEDCE